MNDWLAHPGPSERCCIFLLSTLFQAHQDARDMKYLLAEPALVPTFWSIATVGLPGRLPVLSSGPTRAALAGRGREG